MTGQLIRVIEPTSLYHERTGRVIASTETHHHVRLTTEVLTVSVPRAWCEAVDESPMSAAEEREMATR